MDGRIALADSERQIPYVPKVLTSSNDFRLFLELEAQADCLITHGGYLRALADGRLGNILQIGTTPDTRDLADWRISEGLPAQPDIFVASTSLDFPMPQTILDHRQKCFIATGSEPDPRKVSNWEQKGYPVFPLGREKLVEGKPLVDKLKQLGYRSANLIAGPQILDTMLRDSQLARLYQTITHQLLGGEQFHTLLPGNLLGEKGNLKLRSLYYDADFPPNSGQWFAQFDTAAKFSTTT